MARCVREEDHEVLARVPRRRDDDAVEPEEGRRAADRLACRPVVAFKVGAVNTKRGEDRFIGQVHHGPKLDLELIHGPSCAGAERLNRDPISTVWRRRFNGNLTQPRGNPALPPSWPQVRSSRSRSIRRRARWR